MKPILRPETGLKFQTRRERQNNQKKAGIAKANWIYSLTVKPFQTKNLRLRLHLRVRVFTVK